VALKQPYLSGVDITLEKSDNGYSEETLRKMASENLMRVFKDTWA